MLILLALIGLLSFAVLNHTIGYVLGYTYGTILRNFGRITRGKLLMVAVVWSCVFLVYLALGRAIVDGIGPG